MNWFWKWLGYHVCEEFSQWETHKANVLVTPFSGNIPLQTLQYEATRRWQERRCTICGKIQQRNLKQ